jgi:hypothetical protein
MIQRSYAHGSGRPLAPDTIAGVFDRISRSHADTPAVVSHAQGIALSYGELRTQVDRAACNRAIAWGSGAAVAWNGWSRNMPARGWAPCS